MSRYGVLSEGMDKLRSIDRLIDISKSTIQIDILLTLSRGEMTSAEIAKEICQRRKAITDAMRKLRVKGLVDEVTEEGIGKSARYALTAAGHGCLNTLLNLTHPNSNPKAETTQDTHRAVSDPWPKDRIPLPGQCPPPGGTIYTVDASSFPIAAITSELIMVLGSESGNVMSSKRLARTVGLSEQRLESYLEVYLNGTPKLFRQYVDRPGWAKVLSKLGLKSSTRKTETYYGLTSEGLQYYYRLPSYSKLKNSLSYRVLSRLVGTAHPKAMFKRLTLMLCLGGIVSVELLLIPFGYITTSLWLFATVFVGGVTLLDALLYNAL